MHLREYLVEQSLPAQAFAEKVGVTVQAVHRYLTGERMPRPEVIDAIAKATGGKVTANDLAAAASAYRASAA